MTIIYIHGVKVRSPAHGIELGKSFRRWLQEKLSVGNAAPGYEPVYWGDRAADFRWNLESRPKTAILAQGGDGSFAGLGSLRDAGPSSPLDEQLVAEEAGPVLGAAPVAAEKMTPPLSGIPISERADFLADLYLVVRPHKSGEDPIVQDPALAGIASAAATVADDWDDLVASEPDDEARVTRLLGEVHALLQDDGLLAQGGYADWIESAGETLWRASVWPFDAVATVFAELRPTVHEFVAYFLGDVLTYMNEREVDGQPGEISKRILTALRLAQTRKKATGEKIVVVSHSMGGQLFHDAISYFAPNDPSLADLQVDHWITCGSQVSFFAEMRLLKGQADLRAPQKMARPAKVAAWTNFYDCNDLVGFVMSPVFEGVSDIEYNTGYGLALAHTGFLSRPSFFKRMADAI